MSCRCYYRKMSLVLPQIHYCWLVRRVFKEDFRSVTEKVVVEQPTRSKDEVGIEVLSFK